MHSRCNQHFRHILVNIRARIRRKTINMALSMSTKIALRQMLSRQFRMVSTYRAAVVTALDQPLEIRHLDRPRELPEKSVRLQIHNSSVNFADVLLCQGKYQEIPDVPFSPGMEFAGRVLEVGTGVSTVKVGDEMLGISANFGCTAEEGIFPEKVLIPRPAAISPVLASSVMVVYSTVWMALKRRANIQPGETVLVTSAAGGAGLAAVDTAVNLFGAKAIAACSTDEKCEVAKSRGAFAGINYTREKLSERVKELTGGRGADIIMDNTGGDLFKECLRSIAFEGRIVVIGFTSGEIPQIPANILLVKSCSAVGVYWGSYNKKHPPAFHESIQGALQAISSGKLSPHISKVFPLDQVNEAYQYLLSRQSTGKIVIDCQASS